MINTIDRCSLLYILDRLAMSKPLLSRIDPNHTQCVGFFSTQSVRFSVVSSVPQVSLLYYLLLVFNIFRNTIFSCGFSLFPCELSKRFFVFGLIIWLINQLMFSLKILYDLGFITRL